MTKFVNTQVAANGVTRCPLVSEVPNGTVFVGNFTANTSIETIPWGGTERTVAVVEAAGAAPDNQVALPAGLPVGVVFELVSPGDNPVLVKFGLNELIGSAEFAQPFSSLAAMFRKVHEDGNGQKWVRIA